MWLINLPSDIRVVILFLSRIKSRPDSVKEIMLLQMTQAMDCRVQWSVEKNRSESVFHLPTKPAMRISKRWN